MNVEGKLILAIVEQALSGNKNSKIEELVNAYKINWQKFIELVFYHEFFPFLYNEIKYLSFLFSPDLMELARNSYYQSLAHSLNLWQEFLRILKAFEGEEITLLPIKGIALLEDAYAENYLRAMVDIDVLVKENNLAEAEKIFYNLGYIKELCGLKEEYWRNKQTHISFCCHRTKQLPILIDVHWALDFKRKHRQILPELWSRIREINVEGRKIKLLSPEDTLFVLALHKRRFGKALCLKYALDIILLLRKYASIFDWDYVLKEAEEGKMCSSLFFALSEAKFLNNQYIPSNILKRIRIPEWKKRLIAIFIERNVFLDSMELKIKNLYLKSHFLLYDNFREPIEYILDIPEEQFAKFYNLKPYEKKSDFFYRNRLFYMPFKWLSDLLGRKQLEGLYKNI